MRHFAAAVVLALLLATSAHAQEVTTPPPLPPVDAPAPEATRPSAAAVGDAATKKKQPRRGKGGALKKAFLVGGLVGFGASYLVSASLGLLMLAGQTPAGGVLLIPVYGSGVLGLAYFASGGGGVPGLNALLGFFALADAVVQLAGIVLTIVSIAMPGPTAQAEPAAAEAAPAEAGPRLVLAPGAPGAPLGLTLALVGW